MDASELRRALRTVAVILREGEKTHPRGASNHWTNLRVRDHGVRAMEHLTKYLVGARGDDDDLAHACVRLLLALELRERGENL